MYKINNTINFSSEEKYIKWVLKLIEKARRIDHSVIPHTEEELLERYKTSIICLLNNQIIWNSSIFSTNIEEFKWQNIGEIWSVITDFDYRNKWIWHKMIEKSILEYKNLFSSIVWATINPKMYNIFKENGFIEEKFPESSLEEWKKYLSFLLLWWEKEFLERAKFFRKYN